MKWQELSVAVPFEFVEPVSYLFGRYGRAFSVEDMGAGTAVLRTYLPSTSKQRRERIEVGVKLIGALRPIGALQTRDLEEKDWAEAWKAHFTLLRAGRSLVIKAPWMEFQPQEGDRVIELEPGLAFGTGHHPSTFACLQALEDLVKPGQRMLDLGTGSGILSIAAFKLGVTSIVALDVDPLAVKVARRNLRANGLQKEMRLARGTLPHALATPGSFHLAVANISAKVIKDLAASLHQCLKPGGTLVASGILQDQGDAVCQELAQTGLRPMDTLAIEDWVTLLFSRPV